MRAPLVVFLATVSLIAMTALGQAMGAETAAAKTEAAKTEAAKTEVAKTESAKPEAKQERRSPISLLPARPVTVRRRSPPPWESGFPSPG